jgi:hypothetical protein
MLRSMRHSVDAKYKITITKRNARKNAFEFACIHCDVNAYEHAISILLFSSVWHIGIYEPKRVVDVGNLPRISLNRLFAV